MQRKNTWKLVDKKGGLLISWKNGYGALGGGRADRRALHAGFPVPGLRQPAPPVGRRPAEDGRCRPDQSGPGISWRSWTRWSTDEYSSRQAANAAIYLAEHDSDPNHLISFLEKVYAEDFQPEEGSAYKSVSDAKIKEQMIAAGVSKDVADKAFGRDYQEWLDAIDTYTPKRSELWHQSGSYKGSMTTPTVIINGKYWDMDQLTTAQTTVKDGLLESIGLKDKDEVGVAGKMPSIGAKKGPISVTTGE